MPSLPLFATQLSASLLETVTIPDIKADAGEPLPVELGAEEPSIEEIANSQLVPFAAQLSVRIPQSVSSTIPSSGPAPMAQALGIKIMHPLTSNALPATAATQALPSSPSADEASGAPALSPIPPPLNPTGPLIATAGAPPVASAEHVNSQAPTLAQPPRPQEELPAATKVAPEKQEVISTLSHSFMATNKPVSEAVSAHLPLNAPSISPAAPNTAQPSTINLSTQAPLQFADAGASRLDSTAKLVAVHHQFGPLTLRVDAASEAGVTVATSSADPAFIPAVQAALAERAESGWNRPDRGGHETPFGRTAGGDSLNGSGLLGSGGSGSGTASRDAQGQPATRAPIAREWSQPAAAANPRVVEERPQRGQRFA